MWAIVMRMFCATWLVVMLSFAPLAAAQSQIGVAPLIIPLSGQLKTPAGAGRTGTVLLAIALYDGKDDPTPRWIEYQTVTLDAAGRYNVQFGSTREGGLPPELFTTSTGVHGSASPYKMKRNNRG